MTGPCESGVGLCFPENSWLQSFYNNCLVHLDLLLAQSSMISMGTSWSPQCPTTFPWRRTCKRSCRPEVSSASSPLISHSNTYLLSPTTEEAAVSPQDSRESRPDSSSDQDSEVAHEPIQERYANPSYARFRRVASKTIVSFGHNDPENPVNWRKVQQSQMRLEV